MAQAPRLVIDGAVERPQQLSWAELAALDPVWQIDDLRRIDPRRQGGAVMLAGLLALARPLATADYLTLHAPADDFHASLPLAAVRERGLLIYRQAEGPLPATLGGPFRFFIPDFAACHSAEVDECANVKFVARIELSAGPGIDNRPRDAQQHAAIHRPRA